jgi:glycosyltransferase involved in cell wall biosynthesis
VTGVDGVSTPPRRSTRRKIGVVPARFGPGLVGGAEIVIAGIGQRLAERGHEVEVLTTCARDHFTWANEYEPGVTEESGMTVRRFPAVVDTPGAERAAVEAAILAGSQVTLAQQQRWMNDGVRVPELFHHLLDHGTTYDTLLFGPYPFWPTFACSQVVPDRSVLWTCLHDEPYAYLDLFSPMLSGVGGLLLQTEPEHELAHRVNPRPAPHAVVGCGVEVPASYDPEGFRARYGIRGPFLFYAGRREGAKGWDDLLRAFATATVRRGLPFMLVTCGGGEVNPPAEVADRVIDVGFLPDDERDNAFAAADAYLQPSRYEAFSRTVMESWLAGTPVVANGGSAVVRYHCERSGAGLVYDDDLEFEECLAFLAAEPTAGAALAAGGRDYVLANYGWDDVLDRIEDAFEAFRTAAGAPA